MTSYNSNSPRDGTHGTRAAFSHVLLPEGFALNLCLREYYGMHYFKESLIGRKGADEEHIHPGLHAYDGSFSRHPALARERTVGAVALDGNELVLLATPLQQHPREKRRRCWW